MKITDQGEFEFRIEIESNYSVNFQFPISPPNNRNPDFSVNH